MEGWMEDSILPSIVLETNFGLKDVSFHPSRNIRFVPKS